MVANLQVPWKVKCQWLPHNLPIKIKISWFWLHLEGRILWTAIAFFACADLIYPLLVILTLFLCLHTDTFHLPSTSKIEYGNPIGGFFSPSLPAKLFSAHMLCVCVCVFIPFHRRGDDDQRPKHPLHPLILSVRLAPLSFQWWS